MKTILIERVRVNGEDRIRLHFKFDQDMIKDVKKLPDIRLVIWTEILAYARYGAPNNLLEKSISFQA